MTERHCAAARACRAWDPLAGEPGPDGRPLGAPYPDPPHRLCDPCLTAAEHAIRRLPLDWRDLENHLRPSLGQWGEGGGAHDDSAAPIPMQLQVEALQAAIWRLCTTWEDIARDTAQLSTPTQQQHRPLRMRRLWICDTTGPVRIGAWISLPQPPDRLATVGLRPVLAITRAVRLLTPRLGLLADLDVQELPDYPLDALVGALRVDREPHERWDTMRRYRGMTYASVPGWQGVLDLATLHRRAVSVLGLTSPVKRLPGVCRCGYESLQQDAPRFVGDEQPVVCGAGCGFWQPYEEWRTQARQWAGVVA